MSYYQFQRFINLQWLRKDQLILANNYVCNMMNDENNLFEYYYDIHCYIIKCFSVLKKRNNVRIGLTICNNEIVDFLLDDKHKSCECSNVLYKTNINQI